MFAKKTLLAALLASGALSATAAHAQVADSADTTASVRILKPITIDATQALNFGTVIYDNANGTVSMAAASGSTSQCATVLCTGTSTPALFAVTGTANEAFTVTMPSTVTLDRAGGGGTLAVALTNNAGGTAPKLDASGKFGLAVGGNFTLNASQAGGSYSKAFAVEVAYN